MEKLLLTVPEVSAVLGVGRARVYDLLRMRELRSVTIGRSRRIPVECLREYVARITAEGSEIAA